MRQVLSLVGVAVLLVTVAAVGEAKTITFDEPEAVSVLGSWVAQLDVGGVTFTPGGVSPEGGMPLVMPRTTFDDRSPSPYPYDFISGNLLQVMSTQLRIDFSQPASSFGSVRRWTRRPAPDRCRLTSSTAVLKASARFLLTLDSTLSGGASSNSEGLFFVDGLAGMSRAKISNFGDGIIGESLFGFVVDNVTFQTIPEPSSLVLFAAGLPVAANRRRKPGHCPRHPLY